MAPQRGRGTLRDEVNAFPVQAAKVQPPPLRDDILARDRLLDWLHAKIHQRLVLVIAEAGYGKTTLLADFATRTRLRTLWYRLDEDDRDWVTVMHHLVAAGREHDAGFAPRTAGMLSDTGVAGPSREAVVDAYLRELPSIADHGLILILDDFHLVDESADVKAIAKELLARAPERVSIVIASRRTPTIPIARLRAAGEVAELRTDDLRFDANETARLFSETYKRPLEPDVLRDLSARTEGWAASLQLVQAALRDRSPLEIRRFVRNLTGADQELYDYLAEEVVGDLPDDLQQFLMRTSILQVVTPELAEIVTGLSAADVRRLTTLAERYSLLSRRGSVQRDHLRYHPLVRDFLEDRLEREDGRQSITDLHRTVAEATESNDWRTACYHYSVIGDTAAIGRTIDGAVEEIIARGDVSIADAFLGSAVSPGTPGIEAIRSRSELRRGLLTQALERALATRDTNPDSSVALTTLASIAFNVGAFDLAESTARQLADLSTDDERGLLATALVALVRVSVDAGLDSSLSRLSDLRRSQQTRGDFAYEATTLLNMAVIHKVQGDTVRALATTDAAMGLIASDRHSVAMAAIRSVRAWALAHNGDLAASRIAYQEALADVEEAGRGEPILEACEIETWYGSEDRALALLEDAEPYVTRLDALEQMYLTYAAQLAIRRRDVDKAVELVEKFRIGEVGLVVAGMAQQLSIKCHLAFLRSDSTAKGLAGRAIELARGQGAHLWTELDRLWLDTEPGSDGLNRTIERLALVDPAYLSIAAERIVDCFDRIGPAALAIVEKEVASRPERWRARLREEVDEGKSGAILASRLLEIVGETEDVVRLRRFSRKARRHADPQLGKALARRLAPLVTVEDQGRVAVRIGTRHVEGTAIRRKVLTLMCYLITRPRSSATRDEVLDTLWPEFEPTVALNSLNQTVYFLRRVFEPAYREDTSPGYVRHESDVVWLDRQLVRSRSQRCVDFIKGLPPRPSPEQVAELVATYQGLFALDFAYEDWAVAYRESLHSAFLQVVERAVAEDSATGHFERGITVARRVLSIDPNAEQVELSLLRMLRVSGAHAAAAEQYAHYAHALRESLGIEPPPLDAL